MIFVFCISSEGLHVIKFLVIAIQCEEIIVFSTLYNASFVHYADLVSVLDGGETLGYRDCGS